MIMKTIYNVIDSKAGTEETVFYETDPDFVHQDRFINYGVIRAFDVYLVLKQYIDDGTEIKTQRISKSAFVKKFGKGIL